MRGTLCAVMLSACWSGTAAPPEQPISNISAPSSLRSPAAARERWVGTGRQFDNNSTWDMVLVLSPSAPVGEWLGTIEYPSLACSGHVVREPDEGDIMIGRERITEDPDHHCIDGGVMLIPHSRGSSFMWRWRTASGEDLAEAMLSLESR